MSELVEPLRCRQVFQPVQAEIARVHLDQPVGALRQQHLATVGRAHDPRRPMHIHAHVLGRIEARLARVDPDPQPDQAGFESAHRLLDRRYRLDGRRKGVEKRVTLAVDLVASMAGARLPHDPPVLCQRLPICLLAELGQQPRRALDIGEDERHRPRRLPRHNRHLPP